MKKAIILFLLFGTVAIGQQRLRIVATLPEIVQSGGGATPGVVGQFAFMLTSATISGWTSVVGSPNTGVRTATDTRNGSVTVSSISTSLWLPLTGQTDAASQSGGQNTADAVFPAAVNQKYWYTWASPSTTPNLLISGLEAGQLYTIQLKGARDSTAVTSPTYRWMDFYVGDANGSQVVEDVNVAGNRYSNTRTPSDGLAGLTDATSLFAQKGIATFVNRVAKSDGTLDVVVSSRAPTNASHPYGYLNGLVITKQSGTVFNLQKSKYENSNNRLDLVFWFNPIGAGLHILQNRNDTGTNSLGDPGNKSGAI